MSTSPLKIIVADDEPLLVEELCTYLNDAGHTVVATANCGQSLCDKALELRPDLIVSDIKMPGMDGIEAVMRINQEFPVPFLIVSAYHDDEFIKRAADQCVLAYLVKPIEESTLKTNVQLAMSRFKEFQDLRKENQSLKKTLEDRKLIERAKGILMSRANLTEQEAFLRLQKLSREKSTRMADIAQTILTAEEAFDS